MNIAVVGSGYVGLVSGTCFSEMGNKVTCVDIDQNKIDKLHQGVVPIYEPGLEKMALKNIANKNLFFTTSLKKAITDAEIVLVPNGAPNMISRNLKGYQPYLNSLSKTNERFEYTPLDFIVDWQNNQKFSAFSLFTCNANFSMMFLYYPKRNR